MIDTAFGTSSVVSQNAVLKNTYRLLSLTLIWSAITSYFGTLYPVAGLGSLLIMLAAIGVLFAIRAYRNSGVGVALVFLFTGLMGFSLGPTLNYYLHMAQGAQIVGTSLVATGAAFLGLSAYVHISKKDFAFLSGFLFVGLIGLLVVGLVGMFFSIPGLQLVMAYVSVLVFGGYILFDTSNILAGRETNYISATISLYLDILNMFLAILRIVSGSRD